MRLLALRGEEPPDDTVVVIRAGERELSAETLRRTADLSRIEFGFYGVSVFLALDADVTSLCASTDYLRRYSQIQESTAGRIRSAGFALLATDARPHFAIVLPDLDDETLARLRACFGPPRPNPGRSQTLPSMAAHEAPAWDLWVDFHRVDAAGLTHAHARDAAAGVVLERGQFIVVGDDDADPGVAQVVDVQSDGVVLLRVLPGHADLHRQLLQPRPA